MQHSTPITKTGQSTLRRAILPGHARTLQLLTVAATPRTSQRVPVHRLTDEELFGPSTICGGCGHDTPECFLKAGLCPYCDGTAAHLERTGCPLS